ncbi:MAG: response regulator, partial [Spirochaetales bacterium]|nr:response regulator [Spirochaetales bacterium]
MGNKYKFLILEDVETDAELVMDQIRTTDILCDFKCTDNEVDYKRLIDEFKPDLILSDYNLPTYDGMSALSYVLTHSPDIPVIIVTGSINEETAVDCMKAGAVDYVLKDKMCRLGLAVITALENKKTKLERQKARDEIKKLSTIVEQSPV